MLVERDDRILRLGWEKTREAAEKKMLNYINNTDETDIKIWIEEDKR